MAEGGFEDLFEPADDMSEAIPLVPYHHSLHYEVARHELLEGKVRDFYKSLGEEPDVLDPNQFKMEANHLYTTSDKGEKVQLTYKSNPAKFLSKVSLKQKLTANRLRQLDIVPSTRSSSSHVVSLLQQAELGLPTATQIESVPLQDLNKLADEADQLIQEIETSFSEETSLKTPHELLPMREIEALNQSLQTIRGEIANNLSKLGQLDEDINKEKQKLADADDLNLEQEVKNRISKRLKDLQEEKAIRLEVLSNNREQLRTQVSRIKNTIQRILYEDTTLAERIRTLFREQGITIASILTALGFAISTLVLTLTGGTVTPPPPPSPSSPSDPGWVKKQLKHIAELLKKLAAKALDALPGIIGSIVSWLLSFAGKVVGFMAEHLWTLIVLIAGVLLTRIKQK